MPRVIPVRLEHPAYMLTFERRTELVSFKEIIPQLNRRCAELVTLFSVALATKPCCVVRTNWRPAPPAATAAERTGRPSRTGTVHLCPLPTPKVGPSQP